MDWEPEEQAWLSCIKMELRYNEIDQARQIYERFVLVHPEVKNWIKFEGAHGNISNARDVYSRCGEVYGDAKMDEKLFIAYINLKKV